MSSQHVAAISVSRHRIAMRTAGTTRLSHLEDNQRAARGALPDAEFRQRLERYWDELA
jgi:aryl-alcohol dehydrogenase-like predicted oxidoreductase